ncbi:hypothetical protein MHTCC0001_20820 [Flavobacteriaceae bacterium MHTCC 0001]
MPNYQQTQEPPFVNAHTHTFTRSHTPKYMAKKILPWPFYTLLQTEYMVKRIKAYLGRNKDNFTYESRNERHKQYLKEKRRRGSILRSFFHFLFLFLVWLVFIYYLFVLVKPLFENTWLNYVMSWYVDLLKPIMPDLGSSWNSGLLLLAIILGFRNVRRTLLKMLWNQIKKRIGTERVEFLLRYVNIVGYTAYRNQAYVFNALEQQYPDGTKFVVLPMDMEFMGAGGVEEPYPKQMDEILKLKANNKEVCYPFICIDPRRIKAQSDAKEFLSFDTSNPDQIVLKDCMVKTYFDGGCAGIKIYPALGYYVFDKSLLILWLYCCQNNIPITTHCSIGPVFYRGALKNLGDTYDYHPIFEEVYDNDETKEDNIGALRFHQLKNKDFQKNHTHPLNYLCLLHEPLLVKVIEKYDTNGDLKDVFGYKDGKLTRNLKTLKINLAHYGSAEMWDKFLSQDRYKQANIILHNPEEGLELTVNISNKTKLYSYWHWVDWFSIISSMLLEFDNLYTDISYTAHDLKYINLLSGILENPTIGKRVLFGTDFYVVSNHKTEKQFWIDMKHLLGEDKWNAIARSNPTTFLTSKLSGSI